MAESMKLKQLNRVMELAKYMDDLYLTMENLGETEFMIEAQKSPWENCLYKMREGKNMPDILQEISSPMELMIALKKYDKIKEGK
jgi:hypothetical protein